MKRNVIVAFICGLIGFAACRPPKPPTQEMVIVMAGYEGSLDQCVAAAAKLDAGRYDAYTACADEVDIKFGLTPRSSK